VTVLSVAATTAMRTAQGSTSTPKEVYSSLCDGIYGDLSVTVRDRTVAVITHAWLQ